MDIKPPRAYHLRYPYGHALGNPFQKAQQRRIVLDCLGLLEKINKPGTLEDAPYRWGQNHSK